MEEVCIRRPGALPEIRLLSARIRTLAYRPHAHGEYAIGVVGAGVQRYIEPAGSCHAPAGTLFTLNPGDVHSGEAATDGGYAYRLAYIPREALDRFLEVEPGTPLRDPYFCRRLTEDRQLAPRLLRLLTRLECAETPSVELESELVLVLRALFTRHGELAPDSCRAGEAEAVTRAREMIRERAAEPLTLTEMAAAAGLSRYHFIRVFQKATGLSPHAWLTQERVFRARAAIEGGAPLAEAALASGFSDQSHMTRQFKSIIGTTPGRFRASLLGLK